MNSITKIHAAAHDASPFTLEWHRRLEQKLIERHVPQSEWPRYVEAMSVLTIPGFDPDQDLDGMTLRD